MRKKNQRMVIAAVLTVFSVMISCESEEKNASSETKDAETSEQFEDSISNASEEEAEEVEEISAYGAMVPKGYIIYDSLSGDLNGDGLEDYVVITKGTDKDAWEINQFDSLVDRNRRGIIISLSEGVKSNIVTENLDCFSSENEDGGVYYAPELDLEIKKGKLYVNYSHGRYGYWSYTFRYQQDKMKLIGYDHNVSRGPITEYIYSYNFLTGKKQVKENVNINTEDYEAQEEFKETWYDLPKKPLLTLSSVEDFDELHFD